MQTKLIVIGSHTEEYMAKFRQLPDCSVVFAQKAEDLKPEDCRDAEIVVGHVSRELVEKMPRLRFVQLYSAGANGYAWLPPEIMLANANAYGDAMAEHMLTTTLMAMKRMPEYLQMQVRQDWELLDDVIRMEGARVLSVGMGAIGTAFLKRAAALGAVCWGVRRTLHDQPNFVEKLVTPEGMDELLPMMDVVALSLPGTSEACGMFDERRLRLMKKTAILLNVGRGSAIVTEDLLRVMKDGHLRAACLDVMDPEPLPKGHPLWTAPRVFLTPHVSGGYKAGINYTRVTDFVIGNLALVLQGKPPLHVVNRDLGY